MSIQLNRVRFGTYAARTHQSGGAEYENIEDAIVAAQQAQQILNLDPHDSIAQPTAKIFRRIARTDPPFAALLSNFTRSFRFSIGGFGGAEQFGFPFGINDAGVNYMPFAQYGSRSFGIQKLLTFIRQWSHLARPPFRKFEQDGYLYQIGVLFAENPPINVRQRAINNFAGVPIDDATYAGQSPYFIAKTPFLFRGAGERLNDFFLRMYREIQTLYRDHDVSGAPPDPTTLGARRVTATAQIYLYEIARERQQEFEAAFPRRAPREEINLDNIDLGFDQLLDRADVEAAPAPFIPPLVPYIPAIPFPGEEALAQPAPDEIIPSGGGGDVLPGDDEIENFVDFDAFQHVEASDIDFANFFTGSGVRDVKVRKMLKKNRCIFYPDENEFNDCFWQCLAFAFAYKEDKIAVRKRSVSECRISARILYSKFMKWVLDEGKDFVSHGGMAFPIHYVGLVQECFNVTGGITVLDDECNVLAGPRDDLHLRRVENDGILLAVFEDHVVNIVSYVGFVPFKQCPRCHERFGSSTRLENHMESRVCLTCECMPMVKEKGKRKRRRLSFENESDWLYHMENLQSECPLYTGEDDARKERQEQFQQAQKKRKKEEDMRNNNRHVSIPKDMTEIHEDIKELYDREAIFFDLETVVPMNKGGNGAKRSSFAKQQPYACAWLLATESQCSGASAEPTVVYGAECIEKFIEWLDSFHDIVVASIRQHIIRICVEDILQDPTSRRLKREAKNKQNRAGRVELSWSRYVLKRKKNGKSSCEYCWCEGVGEKGHGEYLRGALLDKDNIVASCRFQRYVEMTVKNVISTSLFPKIPVYAHNGGRFDWLFIHRYLMESGKLRLSKVLRNTGRYINIQYRDLFVFRDSMAFLSGSLENLAKDYKVETQKGVFPYRLMSDWGEVEKVYCGEEEIRTIVCREYFQERQSFGG